jgi:hypothetical protein
MLSTRIRSIMSVGDLARESSMDVVISADAMDDVTFAKHMNFRHADSLGGLKELDLRNRAHLAQMWRSFHNKLHEWRVDLSHEHAPFRPANGEAPNQRVTPIR